MIGVAADVGGTHARFASVDVNSSGKIELTHVTTVTAAQFEDFDSALQRFVDELPVRPRVAALALASPIAGDEIKLTNSKWTISPARLAETLALDRVVLLNDFEAIARSLALLPGSAFAAVGDASFALPRHGLISVVGPGSGLGAGLLIRAPDGEQVIAGEGGHSGFSPRDEIDWQIMRRLMKRHGRVSAERVVSGPGLIEIYTTLAGLEALAAAPLSEIPLWTAAIEGTDALAGAALARWLDHLGSFAGDVALTHGASTVVLAGGIVPRLAGRVSLEPIVRAFRAKGRFAGYMENIGLAMLAHPQPGLIGAASLLIRRKEPAAAEPEIATTSP